MSIISTALKKAQIQRQETLGEKETSLRYSVMPLQESSGLITRAAPPKKNKSIKAFIALLLLVLLVSGGFFFYAISMKSDSVTKAGEIEQALPLFAESITKNQDVKVAPTAQTETITPLPQEAKLPELNGIMYMPTMPQAIINGVIVTEGEVIDGFKVINIYPVSVKLSQGEKEFELKLR